MVSTTQENEEGTGGIQRGQAAGDTNPTMGAFGPGFSVGTAGKQQAVMPATGLRGLMALAPYFVEEEIGGMNARALFQTPRVAGGIDQRGMGRSNTTGVADMGFNTVGMAGMGLNAMGMAGAGEIATGGKGWGS
jgi:hypothetical protein